MSEPSSAGQNEPTATPATDATPATLPPKKRRRIPRWLKIVGVLGVLLILLVLLIPTIASTGPARSFAVGKVNANLNGKVEIASWSLGWLSGTDIKGVRVIDANGAEIVQLASLTTDLSLLDLARRNYSLGDAVIDGLVFQIRRDADGKLNIQKLVKESPKPQSGPATPAPSPESPKPKKPEATPELPDVRGKITLRNSHGTFEDVVKKQMVNFTSIDGSVDLSGKALQNSLTVVASLGDGKPGTVKLSGEAVLQKNGVVLPAINQTLNVENFDVPTLIAFLPPGTLGDGVTFGSGTVALNGDVVKVGEAMTFSLNGGATNVNVSRQAAQSSPQPILDRFALDIDLGGQFDPVSGVRVGRLSIKDNQAYFSITKSDAPLVIPTDAKTQPSGEVVLDADLKKIDDLVHSMTSDGEPTPGGRILGGVAKGRLSVARDGDVVVLKPKFATTGLVLGGEAVKKSADVNLSGEVRLNTPAAETIVSNLEARGPGTMLKLDRPLIMKGSGAAQTISAALSGTIDLPELLTTLEAWNGAAAGSMYPYAGQVVLHQDLATAPGGAVTLAGGADVNNFAMTGRDAAKFNEPLIKLANTIHYDGSAKSVKIDNLSLGMETTKAVMLTMNGAVHEIDSTRRIDNVVVKIDYVGEVLWDLLRPILDPETGGKSLEEITMGGKRSQTIQVSGSFPANDAHAINNVHATGGFGLESLAMRGLAVAQLDLGFTLDKGVLKLAHTNPPPSDKLPPGSPCNGTGQISFHNIAVDMTGDHPRLVIPDGHVLIHDVSINPAVADTIIGRFVNPVFNNATQARGLLNVTVPKCPGLALDKAMQLTNPAESGRAELAWSLTDLFLGQPELVQLVANIKPNALNENGFSGNVRKGKIVIEAGHVQNEMEFNIDKYALRFDGGIGLAENKLMGFGVTLPKALFDAIDEKIGKNARPEGYRLALTGTTESGFAGVQQALLPIITDLGVKAGVDSLLGKALGDKKSKNNEAAEPTTPEDLLGGLLDRATGGGKETDAEKEARRAKNREEKAQKARQAADVAATTRPTTTPAESAMTKKERERLKKEQQRLENQRKREEKKEREAK